MLTERRAGWAAILLAALCWALPSAAFGQQILIDQGTRVEGLWCFPSALDGNHFYYVPATAQLAMDEEDRPRFSFLRYVINRKGEASDQGITEAEGGGVLHFVVTYDTDPNLVRRAERSLQRKTGNDELRIVGPTLFKAGRYALISSVVSNDGREEPALLATGNAPVLEGGQLALSFDLPPDRATLLMESLRSSTPDLSLVFEMTLEGLTDAFDADLVVHWDEVYNSDAWGVGGEMPAQAMYALTVPAGAAAGAAIGTYITPGYGTAIGAGIGGVAGILAVPPVGVGGQGTGVLDQLMQSKAIELRTRGENEQMEALLDKIYGQLLDLMFEAVEIEAESQEKHGGFADMLGMSSNDDDPSGRKPVMGIGLTAGYQRKQIRKTGTTVIQMNSQLPVDRVTNIVFNVGDLWAVHGDDPAIFRTVNLADPAFQQREIHVGIDGAILPEFERYINSVTTILRKRHESGKTTVQEVVVDRETFNREANDFRMIYGWSEDTDRTAWLGYEYRTRWSFKGGGTYETSWTPAEANMIDLYAPYRRKVVRVLGDHEALLAQGVRAVVVQVEYPFFDGNKKDQLRVRTDAPISGEQIELTLPLEVQDYQYRITWIRSQGGRLVLEGRDGTGLLFIDELPEAELSLHAPLATGAAE